MNIAFSHAMTIVSTFVLTGSVLLGGMTNTAQANHWDKKIYSGALCTPTDPLNEPPVDPRFRYQNGVIYNLSSSLQLHIICPVTRDQTIPRRGLKAWGFVGSNKNPRAFPFLCTMKARALKAGASTEEVLWDSKATLDHNSGVRTTTVIDSGVHESRTNGGSYYFLECYIPPGNPGEDASYLASYYVEEVGTGG